MGESLLLQEYRGQGIYKKTVFIAVLRPDNHPQCPKDYQKLDPVWQHFGYHLLPNLHIYYPWKDIDEEIASPKPLSIWVKEL